MGYTRNTGQLSYLITYDGSGNITVPASFTQTTVTSSMLKADSSGKLVAAVAGTDFVAPAGLSAYVPTTRTITINGTTFDLSADRSWSIVSGVSSFNTRTGAITLSSSDVTTALGYTPVTNARTLTINGTTFDLSANRSWTIVAGLSSFNTRTGDITLLDTDVTGALGYTPVTNARTITINGTTYDLSANRTWVVDTSSVSTRVVQKFTATASQTTFTITGGYTVGMVDVFLNGVKLDNATEFTASNGSTVVLTAAAVVNDVVEVYKYGGQFIANNSLRQTTAFTATAGQTTFTVNYSVGFVDVFYNGAKLAAAEFTATNGTSIVLGTACVVNDIVEVVAYNYTVGAFTGVGGSGTTNYISKWAASGTLGNSQIFDNGTNVGIGTNTPNDLLEVRGGFIRLSATSGNGPQFNLYSNGQTNNHITLAQGFSLATDNIGYLYNRANAAFVFGTNNAERMRITNVGNVGIGTSAPVGPLDIAVPAVGSAIAATNAQQAYDYSRLRIKYYTDSNLGLSIGYAGANWTYIQACYNQGSTAPLSLNAFGGNVGIGTANTTGLLTLARNNNITINTSDGSDDGYLAICGAGGDGSGRGGHIYLSGNERGADAGSAILSAGNISNGFVAFRTGADIERVRITNGGNLRFSNVPTDNYQLDTSVAISIANGGTIPFPNFSGLVIVNNFVNGVCAMWLCGAGYTLLIGQSTSGATGVLSYTGGNGGYTWTSNYGSTANYGVFAVRTRPTA
jgi:hypothetical protein